MNNQQQKAPSVSRLARVAGGTALSQKAVVDAELAAEKNMESIILKERHITIGLTSVLLVVVIVLCSLGLATYSMYNKSLPQEKRDKMNSTNMAIVLIFSMLLVIAVVCCIVMYIFTTKKIVFPETAALYRQGRVTG